MMRPKVMMMIMLVSMLHFRRLTCLDTPDDTMVERPFASYKYRW